MAAREESLSSIADISHAISTSRPDTAGNRWCLFLDVDGTLLEIAPSPDEVRVEDSLRQLLHLVWGALDGAVALVSGRTLDRLDELFGPQRWPAAGLHGLERRDASGRLHTGATDAGRLDSVRPALASLVAHTPGALLEDKGQSLALHYRAIPGMEAELRRAMQSIASDAGAEYHVLEGKRVFELKPVVATKSAAIRAFLREPPFAGRRPIFVGDDVTDLDGFAAVECAGGLSVAVGDSVQAQVRVASPRDVRAFLADLADRRSPTP